MKDRLPGRLSSSRRSWVRGAEHASKHKEERRMDKARPSAMWFSIVSIILVIAGAVFSIFGFTFFPARILPREALLPWVSGIYGSVLIGWGITLLLVGKIAFRTQDSSLMKALGIGIGLWLTIEALVSILTGVWFNAGVDIAVAVVLLTPLLISIRKLRLSSSSGEPGK